MIKMCNSAKAWISKSQIARNLQIIFTALLPTVLGLAYSYPDTQVHLNKLGIAANISIMLVFGFVLPLFGNWVFEKRRKKNLRELDTLYLILSGIDDVVASKRQSFYDAIESVDNQNAFQTITQPVTQLNLLTSALCNVITPLSNVSKLKATLILCNERGLDSYLSIVGDDEPSIEIDELNNNDSLAKHVFNTKHFAYIQDTIEDHSTAFYRPQYCETNSIYCYPIKVGSDVHLILCLSSKEKKHF